MALWRWQYTIAVALAMAAAVVVGVAATVAAAAADTWLPQFGTILVASAVAAAAAAIATATVTGSGPHSVKRHHTMAVAAAASHGIHNGSGSLPCQRQDRATIGSYTEAVIICLITVTGKPFDDGGNCLPMTQSLTNSVVRFFASSTYHSLPVISVTAPAGRSSRSRPFHDPSA